MVCNILLEKLPTEVSIGGKSYNINSDFRSFIIFEKIITDNTLSSQEKVKKSVDLFYGIEQPKDIEEAFNAILFYYTCGEETKKEKKVKKNGDVIIKPKKIYSFEYDAPYIYAAFLTQYNIDLNDIKYMHWWKFQALFQGLENHNKIVEIMGYRATDVGKIENKKERARILHLQNIYKLPENLSYEDKVAMAGSAFGGGV
jgi:hypothetical protein